MAETGQEQNSGRNGIEERSLCVLNACTFSEANIPGEAARAAGRAAALRSREQFPHVIVLSDRAMDVPEPDELPLLVVKEGMAFQVFQALQKEYPDYEQYVFADFYAPFADFSLGRRLAQMNEAYFAHYSYGEHYPRGIAPQVLSREALQILGNVASGNNCPFTDEAIFDLMGIDINNYDIELIVAEFDFRRYRLDLRERNRESAALVRAVTDSLGKEMTDVNSADLAELVRNHYEDLRTLPAYVEIDLGENCDLACTFCPREKMGRSGLDSGVFMDTEKALAIVNELAELNPDASLALSPYSEPLLHPDFFRILDRAAALGLRVVLETNGTALDSAVCEKLASYDEEKLIVIVSVDVLSAGEYKAYKKKDLYDQVLEGCRHLLERKERNVYLQILNMEGLSEKIRDFYEFWKEYQDRVLPRKYNSFAGYLPDRAAADFSPLERRACWHLMRDMVIHVNGDVGLCKQDLGVEHRAGNVFTEGLQQVWEHLGDYWNEHARGGSEQAWGYPLCRACDEWFTYNF